MTLRDAVAAHFKAHPNEWIDGLELARIGGAYAWRTRTAECRTQLRMNIQNEQRKVGKITVSLYRFVLPSQPVQAELFKEDASAA